MHFFSVRVCTAQHLPEKTVYMSLVLCSGGAVCVCVCTCTPFQGLSLEMEGGEERGERERGGEEKNACMCLFTLLNNIILSFCINHFILL